MTLTHSHQKPLVSVIMSTYNDSLYLRKSIASILNQTYSNFEFLIIDDASSDNSLLIIESFTDPRLKLFKNQTNQGLTKNLNYLIHQSQGSLIARMDADDISAPNRLAKQISAFQNDPDLSILGAQAVFIDDSNQTPCLFPKRPLTWSAIKKTLLWHNPLIHPSVMIKTATLIKAGGYNENYPYAQDYELWSRLVPFYKSANLKDYLLKYRLHVNNLTKSKNKSIFYRYLTFKIRLKAIKNLLLSLFIKTPNAH